MVDRAELRRLAEAANGSLDDEPWWSISGLTERHTIYAPDAAFIAAASPDVVLGLLDENDQLRAVAVRLKGYLENIQGNTRQDVVRWDCETALADPEVEKL